MAKHDDKVESWFVVHYEGGLVALFINTKGRWVYFHSYTDTTYCIDNDRYGANFTLEEEELGLDKNEYYIQTVLQVKDQIAFYFIPKSLMKKNGWKSLPSANNSTEGQDK